MIEEQELTTSTSSATSAQKEQHQVIGAGPAGLVAAATLARSGLPVRVVDQGEDVGHRFSGDFQGLENWSTTQDVLDWMLELGVQADFEYEPFHEVTFYDHHLKPTLAQATSGPLFYLIRRGPMEGSLDRALLTQARAAGASVQFGHQAKKARRGNIIATGPRYADGLVTGFVFPTSLANQARCIVSERMAPAGYAYLLACNGRATLATCLFRREHNWKDARDLAVAAFTELVPSLASELDHARPFSGQGSVFPMARYV
ncbi:MAG: NAD(P)/FAD-dependent oxidoreductase, partial [Acidimicrobiales bacterium]